MRGLGTGGPGWRASTQTTTRTSARTTISCKTAAAVGCAISSIGTGTGSPTGSVSTASFRCCSTPSGSYQYHVSNRNKRSRQSCNRRKLYTYYELIPHSMPAYDLNLRLRLEFCRPASDPVGPAAPQTWEFVHCRHLVHNLVRRRGD